MRFALKRGPEQLSVAIGGKDIPVEIRRSGSARRLILRIDAVKGAPVLTLPARTALSQGEGFLRKNVGWLETRLARQPEASPFSDGCVFPLRGAPCRIVHRGGRGLIRLEGEGDEIRLSIPGETDHVARRVTEWLKREARGDFSAAVARHAQALGRQPTSLRIGDAKSRWGSCTGKGALTFSWRLVLAPPHVLDYLAAHEVAHLVEMNHGPRFWALVQKLDPSFKAAQAWLKRSGAGLHRYGRGA